MELTVNVGAAWQRSTKYPDLLIFGDERRADVHHLSTFLSYSNSSVLPVKELQQSLGLSEFLDDTSGTLLLTRHVHGLEPGYYRIGCESLSRNAPIHDVPNMDAFKVSLTFDKWRKPLLVEFMKEDVPHYGLNIYTDKNVAEICRTRKAESVTFFSNSESDLRHLLDEFGDIYNNQVQTIQFSEMTGALASKRYIGTKSVAPMSRMHSVSASQNGPFIVTFMLDRENFKEVRNFSYDVAVAHIDGFIDNELYSAPRKPVAAAYYTYDKHSAIQFCTILGYEPDDMSTITDRQFDAAARALKQSIED